MLRLILVATLCWSASAVTWNLTSSVAAAGLQPWIGFPPDNPGCTYPGICQPASVTIKANQLWYWCGYSTKERFEYWVKSSATNVTAFLMRESDVQNCALKNVGKIKSCYQIDNSVCDTKTNCNAKVYGFSFVDPMCFLIANNDKQDTTVSVQVWSYYDSRRYYGTAFSVLLLLIVIFFTLGHMGYTCWDQFRKPSHRLDELERMTRAKLAQQESKVHADASENREVDDAGATVSATGGNATMRRSTGVTEGVVNLNLRERSDAGAGSPGIFDKVISAVKGDSKGQHSH